MAGSYKNLIVWQRAMQLALSVYQFTRNFPREEVYGLAAQMKRAAVSLPSNIAEGHGRLTSSDYRHYLGVARGVNFELQTQLQIARDLGLGDEEALAEAEGLSQEVGKMLYALLESIGKPAPVS